MWYTIIYENQIKLVTKQQEGFNMFEHKNTIYNIHIRSTLLHVQWKSAAW